jgi:hypothetical protein
MGDKWLHDRQVRLQCLAALISMLLGLKIMPFRRSRPAPPISGGRGRTGVDADSS